MDSLERMRRFYILFPPAKVFSSINKVSLSTDKKSATARRILIDNKKPENSATAWRKLNVNSIKYEDLGKVFPLPWKSYVRLMSVKDDAARNYYETECLRGGWTIRQLDRQINSMFYERIALSKNKTAMLLKANQKKDADLLTAEDELKDSFVLEFLGLKDEYSEKDLEEALIVHLEKFLLELGTEIAFVGRQRRMRIDDEWYRVDLIFFHRRLRCLLLIDIKLGKLTHEDVGQMHMYCNYAKEN